MPVFFIHSQDVVDGMVTITDPLLTHISKSLRAKPGDSLLFNDDQGHRYHTTVGEITKQTLQATIQQIEDSPHSTRPLLILAQALLKGEKMGWVIQKATELGIHSIVPVITDRSIPRLSSRQANHHYERWARIALEAAQQSERWTLPTISPLQTIQEWVLAPPKGMHIMLAERVQEESLATLPLSSKQEEGITMIIGPEGGWSPEEIAAAKSHRSSIASLGTGILRAETASLAALAILQARIKYF